MMGEFGTVLGYTFGRAELTPAPQGQAVTIKPEQQEDLDQETLVGDRLAKKVEFDPQRLCEQDALTSDCR